MLIGIDVGGTTTDAVLIQNELVVRTAKVPTDHDHLLTCLLGALDELVQGVNAREIERVVLSTTLITNLIAEGKTEPVGLVLIPGPGTNPRDYRLTKEPRILKGAVDYRGREIQKLSEEQIRQTSLELASAGYRKVAVVGKFCQRNHNQELQVKELIAQAAPSLQVELGHQVSGKLNFPRRAATTLLTLATRDRYREFAEHMNQALAQRGISAPVYILKADGGTLPLNRSLDMPVETIFSGPAASIMGVMALTPRGQTSVVVDIGGTTTDLALILDGKPLLSSKGARVDSMLTHIRAFAVKSVAIGGDSVIRVQGQGVTVGPERAGPAACLDGPKATPTDALRVMGYSQIGDRAKAEGALDRLGAQMGMNATQVARMVLEAVVDRIVAEVNEMFKEWEQEPAYRVWEILQKEKIRPQNVVGVGGASPALVPLVADKLKARGIVLEHAPVANAIGAAVARPTMTLNLRIDTERGFYAVAEDGTTGDVHNKNMRLEEAEDMARKLVLERAVTLGIAEYAAEAQVTHSEMFNMVRGWSTTGRLLDVRMEIPAGIISSWGGA
ncbi:MAG: hydantoinase/oxoprolinase family protein [Methanosarcinales archaeon]|nr:hydantoinase/oxoprolinase family protein [Methanosarcinales archaeon]